MSRSLKWIVGLIVLAGVMALLAWTFVEGRKEMATEREREKPVAVPPRVSISTSGETIVTLDLETQQRIGLKSEALAEKRLSREFTAYGRVADPAPLIALDAEVSAATAALDAAKGEVERLRALRKDAETVSRKALEAAEAQFAAAEARARTARQQLSVVWCDAPLPTNTTGLVLVDLPAGESLTAPRAQARVTLVGHENEPLAATVLCAEPKTEPETQGQGFWLRVTAPSPALRPGVAVTAYLAAAGEQRTGVVIPRPSVVRAGGKTWVYEPVAPDKFARREVSLDPSSANGWFCVTAIRRVVVVGAQMLLSEEMKSQIRVGEEGK